MIHDSMLNLSATAKDAGRRQSARAACPGEVVMCWLHDPDTPLRLRLIDVSNGGYRLSSTLPVLPGTIGIILRLLPEGTTLDDSVMVVWSHRVDDGPMYEIGLRRI